MRTVILKTFVFAVLAMLLSASVSTAQTTKARTSGDELDMAIRDASNYLNDNIPKGSKIVILNIESVSANLSDYIVDEITANAVNDKMFSVVDRRQLQAIQAEQKFQMSGVVDDKDMQEIGKFFGAQTIISGTMSDIGGRYRMTIRALNVQTAEVQGQFNRNMPISATLNALANSGGGRPTNGAPPSTAAESAAPPQSPTPTTGRGMTMPTAASSVPANSSNAEQIILSTGMLVLDAVYFTSGKAELHINSKPYLGTIAKMLVKYPKLKLEIGGHTDNIGKYETNMNLSQKRAEAVFLQMVSVEPSLAQMLSSRGYGSTVPRADNRTAGGRELNRRIELKVLNP